jgi:hypothetical protein
MGEKEGRMRDDLSSFKPLDPGRVNAMDPSELGYWCKQLKCTEGELTEPPRILRRLLRLRMEPS